MRREHISFKVTRVIDPNVFFAPAACTELSKGLPRAHNISLYRWRREQMSFNFQAYFKCSYRIKPRYSLIHVHPFGINHPLPLFKGQVDLVRANMELNSPVYHLACNKLFDVASEPREWLPPRTWVAGSPPRHSRGPFSLWSLKHRRQTWKADQFSSC